MTKGAARKARKNAFRERMERGETGERPRTTREERAHERGMARWARRYDERNGAPEGPEDC